MPEQAAVRWSTHLTAMVFMGPSAAVAILALRAVHLVAPSPVWLVPTMLLGGQFLSIVSNAWWERRPSRVRLHVRVAVQAVGTGAVIYAIGWGPGLSIGLVLVGQETLAVVGSSAERVVLAWNLSCLAAGQVLIALGWAPSLIPAPQVHGLALLCGLGIVFAYRSLRTALVEKEAAAALTDRRERRFRALVQSSSDLVFVVGAGGVVTYASPSCRIVLGYTPEQLLGPDHGLLVHEQDVEALRLAVARAVEQEQGRTAELSFRVRHRDGAWRWLEGIATNLQVDEAVEGVVINIRDVTERRKRLVQQAALSKLGQDVLRESSTDAILAAATRSLEETLSGSQCSIALTNTERSSAQLESGASVDAALEHDLETWRAPVGDAREPLAHIELHATHVLESDDREFVEAVAGIVFSGIIRTRAEDAIRHQATHDALTGLPNRMVLNDRLSHALARRERIGGNIAVMVVDLDGFKNVNDGLGHLTGDAVLIAVADRFESHLRDIDTIARLGGDEFAIIAELDRPAHAGLLAQRVLDSLREPLCLPDRTVTIGISIGVAVAESDENAEQLISHADAAMYRAKREGKGRYRLFEPGMHTAAVQRLSLEQGLRAALAAHDLSVHYQPVIDTVTGFVTSYEALARWRHVVHDYIPPDQFIPLAEESGLIIEVGRAILYEACRQAHAWQETNAGVQPSIAINASRLQLVHRDFIQHVDEALERAELDPTSLILEVTESVLAGDSAHITSTLDQLRHRGIRVAIDDFGTGYSSLAALAELPIDILKIDKRFIDHVTTSEQGRGFVIAIMQLARTLGLRTIAEGVERHDQAQALIELGCSHHQGYLYARPMTANDTHTYARQTGPIRSNSSSVGAVRNR